MTNFKPHEKEINTSKTWYFQLATYVLNMGAIIRDKLWLSLPQSTSDVFGFVSHSGLMLLNVLSITAVVFGWLRFFKHIYNHWGKEKDKDYWINLSMALLSNVAMTTFMILTAVGVAAAGALFITLALQAAPWVIALGVGINALYCLGKAIQNAYEGFFNAENDAQLKSQYRWACLRQILGVVVNTLVLVLTIHLGIFFGAASAKFLAGDWSAVTDMLELYTSMQSLAWGIVGTVAAALTLGWYKGPSPAAAGAVVQQEDKDVRVVTPMGSRHVEHWGAEHKHVPAKVYGGNNGASTTVAEQPIPKDKAAKAEALYKHGESVWNICQQLQISKGALYQCLQERGIKINNPSNPDILAPTRALSS